MKLVNNMDDSKDIFCLKSFWMCMKSSKKKKKWVLLGWGIIKVLK